jgi:hypothetical protein
MSNNVILELFGLPATEASAKCWQAVVAKQWCPFLDRKCLKVRKSQPAISIGTCSVRYGRDDKVKDFVGIELQALDSTGTIWPARQRLLREKNLKVLSSGASSKKPFGINWKMTAKTILVQLHHKLETFEHLGKHLVLAIQDHLLLYISQQFNLERLEAASIGNPLQIHSYRLADDDHGHRLSLANRYSTDTEGLAACLGLQVSPKMELVTIVAALERKLSRKTLFTIGA